MSERPIFIRQLNGLSPDNDAARESLVGLKVGTLVEVKISRPRNLGHHRLFWGLCNAIGQSIGVKSEAIADVLKIRTGHCITIQTKSDFYTLPKSISWAKMDQAQFASFFEDCCRLICAEWLPHMKPGELRKQIEQMVGVPQSEVA